MVILRGMADKKHIPCIYIITNKINNKQYVGKTIDPVRRWGEHKSKTKPGEGYAIDAAIRKHKIENFVFNVIEQHALEIELGVAEKWWIAHQRSIGRILYNETEGGDGISGYHHTEEDKRRMSEIRLTLIANGWQAPQHTEEWKAETHQRMLGHKRNVGKQHLPDCGHCAILRERNANNNPALKMTDETKHKMSEKKKGSKNNNAIMTEEKVIELRQLAEQNIPDQELAIKYGISVRNVRGIRNRNSWKHI
jgi:group I intron endonuclease